MTKDANTIVISDELIAFALAAGATFADMIDAHDINPIQAEIYHSIFQKHMANLLNGRDAGVVRNTKSAAHGTSVKVNSPVGEETREMLQEAFAKVTDLGKDGCVECEKQWQAQLDMFRDLLAATRMVDALVGKKGDKKLSSLDLMPTKGNA